MRDMRYAQHNELVNKTLLFLSANHLGTYWSNPTGALLSSSGHFQRYCLKGSSDIIGISNSGIFVGIEIKTGKAVQSAPQKNFQRMVEKQKGLYIVVRSVEEFDMLKEKLIQYVLLA